MAYKGPTRAQHIAAKVAKTSAAFFRRRQQDAALAFLGFDSTTWKAIDKYRAAQPDNPSRIVAVARLVQIGLDQQPAK
jgi:hypothetical protein